MNELHELNELNELHELSEKIMLSYCVSSDETIRKIRFNSLFIKTLECHSVLEDGDFAVVVLLVTGRFAAGDGEDLVDEFGEEFLHGTSLDELSGVEVHP